MGLPSVAAMRWLIITSTLEQNPLMDFLNINEYALFIPS